MDETADDTQAPASDASPIGTRIGKYTLVRELGRGGMGVVWAARDPDLDREIAIKLMRSAGGDVERARFSREARAMARLKHPNVLTVYEAGVHEGTSYIAMELVEGENLDAWLSKSHSTESIWSALLGAGHGLAAAHEAGLVHRDFKPHNVLIRPDGRVLVTDFGLVRSLGEEAIDPVGATAPVGGEDATVQLTTSDKLTRTGVVMGTPAYMAPEQFEGGLSDPRTDQFAFCVTAWQALTGKRPFSGDTLEELQKSLARGPAADANLERLVRIALLRGLASAPDARFPTMTALLDDLEDARRAPRRRRIAMTGVAAAIGVLAVVVAVWKLRPELSTPAPPPPPAPSKWTAEIVPILPPHVENSDCPTISPDGKWLLFPSQRVFDGPWLVYRQSIDGGEPTVVSPPDCLAGAWDAKWNRDSKSYVTACGKDDERTFQLFEHVIDGPSTPLGPGLYGERCGDRLLVIVQGAHKRTLVWRDAAGRDEVIAEGHIERARCDHDGRRIAFIRNNRRAYAEIELWLYDGKQQRLLLKNGVLDVAFTPKGSVVIARFDAKGLFDLFELVLADLSLHRLTTGANARAADVSRDGTTVVFDSDTTTFALFEHTPLEKRRVTSPIEALDRPAVSPMGDLVVVERLNTESREVVLVNPTSGAETRLATGRAPFFSRDGKRVMFVASDNDRRLDSVPVGGGTPTPVATLPQPIVDGVDADDGVHVEVGQHPTTRAFIIPPGGEPRPEQVDGLVFPGPGGWRAVRTERDGTTVLRLVAPGRPLTTGKEIRLSGRPHWIGGRQIGVCEGTACHVYDVITGAPSKTTPIKTGRTLFAVGPDGARWYAIQAVGHVTRHKIVNFAARPWRP